MTSEIQNKHKQLPAYIYLRQSTMGQVHHHQESTERQYALSDKALSLGWEKNKVKILDGDLGISGTQSLTREDFKTLVADVSMNKVGAVFALEASRLSRSCTDWHRLLELCSLTETLIIDEDGCYNPADFNDQLLLGLKGTFSQAELHFIRARLQGGKLNKAKKGELRFPLSVGYIYDDEYNTIKDPDEQVRNCICLIFKVFREVGSAFGVVQYFLKHGIKFPKRAYGGVWNGKIIWGTLSHNRVLCILKNPSYTGTYVYGKYKYIKKITEDGSIHSTVRKMPQSCWQVMIKDHHEAYLTWEEYLENIKILKSNRTNGEENMVPMAAREGKALLQGLLLCKICGRRLATRYTGNNGINPTYQCNRCTRDGLSNTYCMSIRCDIVDDIISEKVLEAMQSSQIDLAIKAVEELERRDRAVDKQWQMRIERAQYSTQLAQRRYEEVDPANRLVAATLEKRWNDSLVELEKIHTEHNEFREKNIYVISEEKKKELLSLAENFPLLWKSPTTKDKDRKRLLRLLIKDITIEREKHVKKVILHIRWQGGVTENISIDIPLNVFDRIRYGKDIVNRIRELASQHTDGQIAEILNAEGIKPSISDQFTTSSVRSIRYKHKISGPKKQNNEFTVQQVMKKFNVSNHVIYYWISRNIVSARRLNHGSPYWITLNEEKEEYLRQWVQNSVKINKLTTTYLNLNERSAL